MDLRAMGNAKGIVKRLRIETICSEVSSDEFLQP